MKTPINLGHKDGMSVSPCCAPEGQHYPMLFLSGLKEGGFPESGTMVIRFERKSESVNDKEGDKHDYDVSLKVSEIVSVQGDDEDKEEDTGSALDRLRNELLERE